MKLVFATNNLNKLKELTQLIPKTIHLIGLSEIGCLDDIPETQPSIEGNAKQKAEYVYKNYGYNCFADDTGLFVDHLNGAPGVYSARYAGNQKKSEDNMDKLIKELYRATDRSARFKTVISLILNGEQYNFTGICEGEITKERQGKDGFGYDPIFKPKGYDKTFAQMGLDEKNSIGHRGKAVRQLVEFLENI